MNRTIVAIVLVAACQSAPPSAPTRLAPPAWEAANPIQPLPAPPLGVDAKLTELSPAPTPERVRLGRWLFYDTRLSAAGDISCASCHMPDAAFSQPTPVATGHKGQMGTRKSPKIINLAWPLYPHFFWDGRAASLEEQALGPIANPIEMASTHQAMVETLSNIKGYAQYFEQAFGTREITKERVAQAIADYERTRMSGNSPWDRWQATQDPNAVSADVKAGHELFHGKAGCNQCHLGFNFTDTRFHNIGVGYDLDRGKFKDEGRAAVTRAAEDLGAFKTPGLRDCTRHAPYMHDGSIKTLAEVIDLYNRGGEGNPNLDPKIKPLMLNAEEKGQLLAFLIALDGEGWQDKAPAAFPQ
jgi:cytochrome c peroxidase